MKSNLVLYDSSNSNFHVFDKLEFTLINIFQTLYDYQSGLL